MRAFEAILGIILAALVFWGASADWPYQKYPDVGGVQQKEEQ